MFRLTEPKTFGVQCLVNVNTILTNSLKINTSRDDRCLFFVILGSGLTPPPSWMGKTTKEQQ